MVPAAGLIGPLLGGVLADLIGYRAIFYVVGSVCVTGGIVAAFTLTEKRTAAAGRAPASVRENIGVAWRHADLRRSLVAMVASQAFITSLQPIFVLYVEQLGVETRLLSTTTGVLFAATGITALVAAPWWGRRGDRRGYRGVLTISLAGSAVLLFLQALVTGVGQLFVLRLLYGCFVAGVLPPLLGFISAASPADRRGGLMGLSSSAIMLGNLFGPAGWVDTSRHMSGCATSSSSPPDSCWWSTATPDASRRLARRARCPSPKRRTARLPAPSTFHRPPC